MEYHVLLAHFADFRFRNACDFVFSVDAKFDQGLGPLLKM